MPFTPVAGSRVGPYQLVEKLGEGGMGAVWKAVHTRLEKTVAVKLLPDRLLINPNVIARFEREMRAAGRVVHPNVIQAFDAVGALLDRVARGRAAGDDIEAVHDADCTTVARCFGKSFQAQSHVSYRCLTFPPSG